MSQMYYHPPQKKKKFPSYVYIIGFLIIALLIAFLLFKPSHHKEKLATKGSQKLSLPKLLAQNIKPQPKPKLSDENNSTSSHINETIIKHKIKTGDSLSSIFDKLHISQQVLQEVLDDIAKEPHLLNLKKDKVLTFTFDTKHQLKTLVYEFAKLKKLKIQRLKDKYSLETIVITPKHETKYLSAKIEGSLYTTGQKQHIPHSLLRQLTKIFNQKINFARDIRPNDHFTLIYQTDIVEGQPEAIGNILAASFTTKNKTYFALPYKQSNKPQEFYTPKGKSLKLSFDRYPLHFSHISSNFDPHRMHPILNRTRPHKGVDLAAKYGTPIKAVANGYITQIGVASGYGKVIKIKHSGKYETVYAHMSRFKAGLKKGAKVNRGDTIGYVGQTGLATAPHCHFEFRIYGQPKNPATISLPMAPDLKANSLAQFQLSNKELLGQLKLYDAAAQNGDITSEDG